LAFKFRSGSAGVPDSCGTILKDDVSSK